MKLADKYLLKIALCHDSAIYYTDENALLPNILEKFGAKYQKVSSYENYISGTLEVVIVGDYHDTVKHVSNKMAFPYTYGVRTVFYKSQGNTYYLEIRKMGSSKGEGLKKLLKYLKLKEKETAVLGDWYNDKSLFETDALKIAVSNAVPELKYMADFVTKRTNNEDGVAEFLKVLYKAKK
jgi:hydroxymethylpyrimidine pyrophosphatase-like HAD family hydrolase